jgi:hypothetical protein
VKGAPGISLSLFTVADLGDGGAKRAPSRTTEEVTLRAAEACARFRARDAAAALGGSAIEDAAPLLFDLGEELENEPLALTVQRAELADEEAAKFDTTRSRLPTRPLWQIVEDLALLGARMDAEDAARRADRARRLPPGHGPTTDGEPVDLEHDGGPIEHRPCLVREDREPSPEHMEWWRGEMIACAAYEAAAAAVVNDHG